MSSTASSDTLSGSAKSRLRSLVGRIERLEEDKAAVAADLKEVYAEAKGEGFDTKILRKVIRLRKQDAGKAAEEAALIELYQSAIQGDLFDGRGGIDTITLTSGGKSVSATPAQMSAALDIVSKRPAARRRARSAA